MIFIGKLNVAAGRGAPGDDEEDRRETLDGVRHVSGLIHRKEAAQTSPYSAV
ncbi:hypothetical protein ACVW1A_000118 [Bradyrhizobium sp. LB1.3]